MKASRHVVVLLLALAVVVPAPCFAVHWGAEPVCTPPTPPVPARPPATRSDGVLHALSWNLHGAPSAGPMAARLGRVAAEILRRGPDVVLLQELWFADDARRLADALGDGYLRVPDDPQVSDTLLYRLIGLRSGGLLAFVARDSAWRLVDPSRFERFRAGPPWWRSPLDQGDGLAEKGVQSFTLVRAGVRIRIANTHLQARYAASPVEVGRDAAIRDRQVAQLLRGLAPDRDVAATLLFGDFNLHPDEATYRRLTQDWVDLTRGLQCPTCATHLSRTGRPGGWVDYVLVRARPGVTSDPRMALIENTAVDCPYSDHQGLDLQIGIEAQ